MTTAAVVAYYTKEREARVSYAGHPPILYWHTVEKAWSYARPSDRKGRIDGFRLNLPLAVDLDALYEQLTIPMAPGDRLFVYTDGIIDTPDPEGNSFGLVRLKDILDANTATPLPKLKSAVLKTLQQFSGKELTHDDVTLIALEIC
jgi:sigma-B regulation protein RsbU (phosphoserine phosphatase)